MLGALTKLMATGAPAVIIWEISRNGGIALGDGLGLCLCLVLVRYNREVWVESGDVEGNFRRPRMVFLVPTAQCDVCFLAGLEENEWLPQNVFERGVFVEICGNDSRLVRRIKLVRISGPVSGVDY